MAIIPVPADFLARRETMTLPQLQEHYQVSGRTIRSWIKAKGLPSKCKGAWSRRMLLMPDGFGQTAPTMSKAHLMKHYKVSQLVIDRWICEAGVTAKAPRNFIFTLKNPKSNNIPPPKRETKHDLAADYLRKFMAVSRCDERGRYQQGGDYFKAGTRVVTFSELIEKADRLKLRKMENA